ncbi:acyltransferase [Paraburkholderia kirstenboschensis]|uniref:Acyltransferase family protein n=1 Tax=Paraburkholderia kirstenboschensis TaxID=1245436 RepID=A0ABZ0ECW3_9BURK|nr:acyltransferase family protein [Paraburkholderia kirstenboschensis]WOD14032.1 acyltransferase family protein [Paraburkholderia kirstenboschensis]
MLWFYRSGTLKNLPGDRDAADGMGATVGSQAPMATHEKERNAQLDLSRALAIVLVVMIHLNDRIFDPIAAQATGTEWALHAVLNAIGRLAVPIFFMISGALVIPRADPTHIVRFYKKRIPQFVVLLVLYYLGTNYVAYLMHYEDDFNIWSRLQDLAVGRMRDAFHLWFIPALIGVYLAAPFINAISRMAPVSTLRAYCVVGVVMTMLPFTTVALTKDRIWTAESVEFFGSYVIYFVLGHLFVNTEMARHWPTWKLTCTGLLSMAIAIGVQCYYYRENDPHFHHAITDYRGLFTAIPSACLFLMLLRVNVRSERMRSASEYCSRLSFGVYLIHLAILHVVLRLLQQQWAAHYALLPPALIVIVALSFGYALVLSRIPVLRKLVV